MLLKLFILAVCLKTIKTANILGLMGIPSASHFQFNSAIMHELGRRGHNVTVLSLDLPKKGQVVPPNVHYIHLENVYKQLYENNGPKTTIDDLIGTQDLEGVKVYYQFCMTVGNGIYTSKGFQQLMDYPDDFKFDVVLYDYSKGPFMLGFLEKFNYPPLIGVTPFLNPPITEDLIGHSLFPSYIPHWSTTYDVEMSFLERVHNYVIYTYEKLFRRFVLTPHIDKISRKFYPPNTPYLGDLEKRAVLALVNSHPAVNYPESLPPNVIEVGGLQITDAKKPPKEIDDFMNSSEKGVVYFSFGTYVKAEHLKEKRIKMILKVMATLSQYNFLWKMDIDQKDYEIPKNVLVRPFFPQRDILGHSKVKVFVTHSGGLGTQEAIWFGVPMIGMALFVDQPRNLHRGVVNGIAVRLDYSTFTEEELRNSILKVAEDESFARNMKERSRLYRDQPMKPLDRAVWWVEFVIRNPNATHLRSPTLDMNSFTVNSLDVLGAFIVLVVFGIFLVLKIVSFVCKTRKSKEHKKTD